MKSVLRRIQIVGLSLLALASVGIVYQNCSKVEVTDLPSASLAVDQNLPRGFSKVTVGTGEMADLKMLFVVDNSYTMTKNNINLAAAFPTLFNSQNSDNLGLFNVSSYLLTVAQAVPAATASEQSRLKALLNWQIQTSGLTASQLTADRSAEWVGKVAGDSIGYGIQTQGSSYSFPPAAVLGVSSSGQVISAISKNKSEPSAPMIQDFLQRLNLLQGMSLANYQANQDLIDRESGLCAAARILRNPSSFVKSGDLPVISIFTDEDDADVAGNSCIDGYTYSKGDEDLVDGACEARKTTFSYKISATTPAKCEMSYQNSFTWKLTYNVSSPSSTLSYYTTTGFNCPQTQLNYNVVTSWQKRKTALRVAYKNYVTLDGVKKYTSDTLSLDFEVDGTKTSSDCVSLAKSKLSSSSQEYISTDRCEAITPVVSSCSFSDANCIIASQTAKAPTRAGDYTSNSACLSLANSLESDVITSSVKCALTGATVGASFSYPSCTAIPSANRTTLQNIAKDLSTQAACESEAANQNLYFQDTSHLPVCTTSMNINTASKSGTFNTATYASVTALGSCPSDVLAQATSSAGTTSDKVIACSIEAFNLAYPQANLTVGTCAEQASSFCASYKTNQDCKLNRSIPAGTTQIDGTSVAAAEELSCDSKCQDSKTGVCQPTGSLPSVSPSLSIRDYLTQSRQALSCTATVSASKVSDYQAVLKSKEASICAAKDANGTSIYPKTSRTYRYEGLAPSYVSGNKVVNGQIIPNVDLPTYILQRSNELFGSQKPIVNIFIRTASDPLGENGSRGLAYERLALMMGGKVQSVLSSDYSPALKDLSTVIKSKLMRSFKVPGMATDQKVVAVKLTSAGQTLELEPSQWSQAGQTVQIQEQILLTLGDELEFEFK